MNDKSIFRSPRSIISLILVICYGAGLLCMLLNAFPIGLALWSISTIGGLAVMYHLRVEENKKAEAERLRKIAENDGDESCE
ncbi:MAG: hypothetical protein U0L09_01885 [Christensenellales bacterium]|nr:hypothetical protein [Christensenellales bacterium]